MYGRSVGAGASPVDRRWETSVLLTLFRLVAFLIGVSYRGLFPLETTRSPYLNITYDVSSSAW